eukprot:TRINITY_DN6684_c0_g1_i1.p1 TRINITY_DN6684_c0_g1~~TRINITY_DN6684_c0_g1_i1.p1  ORF type:complete len:284 (+),score=49.79 TRINITY_DN6684_c0_g1_i1:20-871(+)
MNVSTTSRVACAHFKKVSLLSRSVFANTYHRKGFSLYSLNSNLKYYTNMANQQDTKHVIENLNDVKQKISVLAKEIGLEKEPRLVAVSKLKPSYLIKACYDDGHKTFGENYVQELIEKSAELPKDIQWHFIGHLQSNKCKQLLQIQNLDFIETVDSEKLAKTLNKLLESQGRSLNVMIQVNTSGEEAKNGIEPKDCAEVVGNVIRDCKMLKFAGLMTIGQFGDNPEKDFDRLVACKKDICEKLNLAPELVELSMGMSGDYEQAIRLGSTNVRVGSTIFGERNK